MVVPEAGGDVELNFALGTHDERLFSSLTNRIFVASAALAVLAIAVAVYRVNVAVTAQAENELQRGLDEAGTLLEEYRTTLFEHFSREARLIADLPKLKAARRRPNDPPTVQPIAERLPAPHRLRPVRRHRPGAAGCWRRPAGSAMPRDDRGRVGTRSRARRAGHEAVSLWPHARRRPPGRLGAELHRARSCSARSASASASTKQAAARFKALTNSEIAFAVDGRVQASTLPPQVQRRSWRRSSARDGCPDVELDDSEYVAVSRPLPLTSSERRRPPGGRQRRTDGAHPAVAHRAPAVPATSSTASWRAPRSWRCSPRRSSSYAVARTVTRPLGAITATMREMAATGDLTRRIALPPDARWDDEDARLLATTFNTMTDSIARFQREAAQRERLSSLGRLSTVVAHEIRNPLMIIKTALRALRRDDGRRRTTSRRRSRTSTRRSRG